METFTKKVVKKHILHLPIKIGSHGILTPSLTLIQINLKSIKKNKNAGSTRTMLRGRPDEVTIEGHGYVPEIFRDETKAIICSETDDRGGWWSVLLISEFTDEIRAIPNIIWNVKVNWQQLNHSPVAEYNYSYEAITVKCKYCGKRFSHTELKSDVSSIGDEYNSEEIYSNTVCPICKAWDCVDIKYETIEEALERKKDNE